jgi:hypothetical protein
VEIVNVACLYCGDAYSIDYVVNLRKALDSFLTVPFKFHIFTDKKDIPSSLGVTVQLPKIQYNKPWWHKIWLFSNESTLSGTVLYFDLDVVIIKNVDVFVSKSLTLHLIHDFNRSVRSNINLSNSSIMSWHHSKYVYLWEKFNSNKDLYSKQMHGDQDFIHKYAVDKIWYKDSFTSSYKWEYLKKKNYSSDTRAIVFHGKPKPHEVQDKLISSFWG